MKNIQKFGIVGTLLIGMLTACPSPAPTPPSPAGTYTDNAVVQAGFCSTPANAPTLIYTFTIGQPTSTGSIALSLNTQATSYPFSATYNNSVISGSISGTVTLTLAGSVNFSTNRFIGTMSAPCGNGTTGTVSFSALKQ